MGKSVQAFWGSRVATRNAQEDLMHQEVFGLQTNLGVLISLTCKSSWCPQTQRSHTILISLGLPNIYLSLSQLGTKAVQKRVFSCGAFIFFSFC